MHISCHLIYKKLFSVKVLNVTKKMHMGNCFSHESTFPSYAFNQVIKRLEIWLCWKAYWLYLHKTRYSSLLDLFPCQIIPDVCTNHRVHRENLLFAWVMDHVDLYIPVPGFWRGASATAGSPHERQTSPGKPVESPFDNFVGFLNTRLLAGSIWSRCRRNDCRLPGSAQAGCRQQVSSEVYCRFVVFFIAARQWIG